MDVTITKTTRITVPNVWRVFTISHSLAPVNGVLEDNMAFAAYSQTMLFDGDSDGAPVYTVETTDPAAMDRLEPKSLDSAKLRAALEAAKVEDGRTVLQFLSETLNAIAQEA